MASPNPASATKHHVLKIAMTKSIANKPWAVIALLVVAVAVAAFATGGVALILHLWWLFWVCLAIDVLAIPAGKAVRIMDDTVSYETSAALTHGTSPPAGETAPPAGEGATGPPEPRYQG